LTHNTYLGAQMNENVNAFHRNFSSEIKRCDELQRKLRYVRTTIERYLPDSFARVSARRAAAAAAAAGPAVAVAGAAATSLSSPDEAVAAIRPPTLHGISLEDLEVLTKEIVSHKQSIGRERERERERQSITAIINGTHT